MNALIEREIGLDGCKLMGIIVKVHLNSKVLHLWILEKVKKKWLLSGLIKVESVGLGIFSGRMTHL